MVIKNRLLILMMFFSFSLVVLGQAGGINTTQYYNTPLLYNPAETGHYDGKFRASALYGDQWAVWQTIYGSYEHKFKNKSGHSFDLGVGVFQDGARAKSTGGELSLAGRFKIGEGQFLTIAANPSYFQVVSADLNDLTQVDQYNPSVGDYSGAASEIFNTNNRPAGLNLDAGILWAGDMNGTKIHTGVFVGNIISPDLSQLATSSASKASMKIGVNGGADFPLTDEMHIEPKFMIENKLDTRETKYNFASIFKYIVPGGGTVSAFNFGPLMKTAGDISNVSFLGGVEFGNLALNISYDYGLNATVNGAANGFEFSLIYIGKAKPMSICARKVCPRF